MSSVDEYRYISAERGAGCVKRPVRPVGAPGVRYLAWAKRRREARIVTTGVWASMDGDVVWTSRGDVKELVRGWLGGYVFSAAWTRLAVDIGRRSPKFGTITGGFKLNI